VARNNEVTMNVLQMLTV